MKNRVSIYWDFENVRVPHQAKCLLDFAQSKGDVVTKKVYSHWWRETRGSEYVLDLHSFERIDVLEEFKNSADRWLKSDCHTELYSTLPPDIIILVSGDKGFTTLIRKVKFARKQAIVFGREGVTSHKLIELADGFYYAEDLCNFVG